MFSIVLLLRKEEDVRMFNTVVVDVLNCVAVVDDVEVGPDIVGHA